MRKLEQDLVQGFPNFFANAPFNVIKKAMAFFNIITQKHLRPFCFVHHLQLKFI